MISTSTAAATSATVLAHPGSDGPGWWIVFPIFWLAFFVFVVVMALRFGPWRRRWHDPRSGGESRLAERYAAGEIDADEYRSRLAVLREARPGDRR
ncbi:SHOCT domain-containing protein [Mumia sp. Pv 4-285]|uniref:SHOCT domain-containing protein n=1 Tax=Mumia qirimensis TaxID=3234852 RepID=UPI00351D9B06